MARIRREGREAHAGAVAELEKATERLRAARERVHQSGAEVATLERAVAERAGWDGTHGWRPDDVARIRAELDRHRASVTLRLPLQR